MKVRLYQVDAFANRLFTGNPAAVCPLDGWLPEDVMQSIEAENNLSETAFFVPHGDGFEPRWFTPLTEVDLCGHAMLAAAFVLFYQLELAKTAVRFFTKSGVLEVTRQDDLMVLDLPSRPALPCPVPDGFAEALGKVPQEMLLVRAYLAVYQREAAIAALHPNVARLEALRPRNVIVTASGEAVEFVSRYFAPSKGVPEDPLTGSAHCSLIRYWSKRLGKKKLPARQLSRRGGTLFCEDRDRCVRIAGHAVLYLEGLILL
jgi:predicted PhzF superfamily epimerase YddE/YHI9